MLIPPDALPFQGHPNGQFLGYTWMALPFTDPTTEDRRYAVVIPRLDGLRKLPLINAWRYPRPQTAEELQLGELSPKLRGIRFDAPGESWSYPMAG